MKRTSSRGISNVLSHLFGHGSGNFVHSSARCACGRKTVIIWPIHWLDGIHLLSTCTCPDTNFALTFTKMFSAVPSTFPLSSSWIVHFNSNYQSRLIAILCLICLISLWLMECSACTLAGVVGVAKCASTHCTFNRVTKVSFLPTISLHD